MVDVHEGEFEETFMMDIRSEKGSILERGPSTAATPPS
jgi:hypothetical protein